MPAYSPIIILDAGPIVAALNKQDADHAWAVSQLAAVDARRPVFITTAAIAETTHLLGNDVRALGLLATLLEVMQREDPAPREVLALMQRWAPRMDYADASAVILAGRHRGAIVLTTDHRDFSAYKVPFVSPRGEFHA